MNERDDRLDSAKGLLIALVVLGHWLEATNYWDEGLIRFLLTLIYAFHMPAFIFLAGMTSKPGNVTYRIALLLSLLVLFQGLYAAYLPFMDTYKEYAWTNPFWGLWFLLAMVWWLIALSLAQHTPRLALLVSLGAGVLSGTIPAIDYIPALDRALYFLPWFMAGYVIGQPLFARATATSGRATLGLSLLSLSLAALLWHFQIGSGWLYGSNGFAVLDVSAIHGIVLRSLLLLIAGIMAWTSIALASRLRTLLVIAGRRSLAIYLLHGFLVLAITPWLSQILDRHGAVVAALIAMTGSALLLSVLSLSVFDRSLRAVGSKAAAVLFAVIDNVRKTIVAVIPSRTASDNQHS